MTYFINKNHASHIVHGTMYIIVQFLSLLSIIYDLSKYKIILDLI